MCICPIFEFSYLTRDTGHGTALKFIDPCESGAVLLIDHINGFKNSERTIYGCMDDKELVYLFAGLGYQCCFVEDLDDIDSDLHSALEWALNEIRTILHAARTGAPLTKPRWTVISPRTPKGWGCPKRLHGEFIEGFFRAHHVPLPAAKSDPSELEALQSWLHPYCPDQIFDLHENLNPSSLQLVPTYKRRLGTDPLTCKNHEKLHFRSWKDFSVCKKGTVSSLAVAREFLDGMLQDNTNRLRGFSLDELVSNRLSAMFRHTGRNFQWDKCSVNQGERMFEILSEDACQGQKAYRQRLRL